MQESSGTLASSYEKTTISVKEEGITVVEECISELHFFYLACLKKALNTWTFSFLACKFNQRKGRMKTTHSHNDKVAAFLLRDSVA